MSVQDAGLCLALFSAEQDSFFELAKAARILSKSLAAQLAVSFKPPILFCDHSLEEN